MGKAEIITKINSSVDEIDAKLVAVNLSAGLQDEIYDAQLTQIINGLSALEDIQQSRTVELNVNIPSIPERLNVYELKALREQLVVAKMQIESAHVVAQRMICESNTIRLGVETQRAIFAAEMELEKGRAAEESNIKQRQLLAEKKRIAEKISKRKSEITAVRNGLQDVKDAESAFVLREKLFSIQLVLDDDERTSPDITYLLSKSMDDINHAVEICELKRRIISLNKRIAKAPATQNIGKQNTPKTRVNGTQVAKRRAPAPAETRASGTHITKRRASTPAEIRVAARIENE